MLVNERLPDSHSRGEGSCELIPDLVWLRVWAGAPTLAITGDRADGALVQVPDFSVSLLRGPTTQGNGIRPVKVFEI